MKKKSQQEELTNIFYQHMSDTLIYHMHMFLLQGDVVDVCTRECSVFSTRALYSIVYCFLLETKMRGERYYLPLPFKPSDITDRRPLINFLASQVTCQPGPIRRAYTATQADTNIWQKYLMSLK